MTTPFIDLKSQYEALEAEIRSAIDRVLKHGQFILGPEVDEMESALASYTGSRECVAVGSGTDALLVALMALEIGPGDEVIVPAFTFAATAEVVLLVGATPVLVDVEEDTANIDAAQIADAITERTRAIIPVALYGQPADMDQINELAASHDLTVIEDAAQSFGAEYRGRRSCNLSAIGCTSFFPSKPLGCYGDGGAIFTNEEALAKAFREIRVHGQSGRYNHTRIGLGGRMDTIQCAIVLAKLNRLEWEVSRRIEIGERYNTLFDDRGIRRISQRQNRTSVFAQYTILVDDRDQIVKRLAEHGIPTAIHYPAPLNKQPAYADKCVWADLTVSEKLAKTVLSLPMHPYLKQETQDHIVQAACSGRISL